MGSKDPICKHYGRVAVANLTYNRVEGRYCDAKKGESYPRLEQAMSFELVVEGSPTDMQD